MSFFFNTPARKRDREPVDITPPGSPLVPDQDKIYGELISQRPALLDEKLKLHARIIDEFNLALLDKLSPDELLKIVLGLRA